jgi:hypothetical protein
VNENMKTKITIIIRLYDGDTKEIIKASNDDMVDLFAEVLEQCQEVMHMQPEETHIFLDDITGTAAIIKRESISYIEITRNAEVRKIKDPNLEII